jgi:hypothetical protein
VIRGSVRRAGDQLELEANSVERLGALQQQVLAAAPGAELVSESRVPVGELLAEHGDPQGGAERDAESERPASSALGIPPEVEAAVLEEAMREYELRWLDQRLPALGGRTPRQATADGGSEFAELQALLDDTQWRSDTTGGGMSAARIRHHLGLADH